jgi:hypothetical protein
MSVSDVMEVHEVSVSEKIDVLVVWSDPLKEVSNVSVVLKV